MRNKLILFAVILTLAGCAEDGKNGAVGPTGAQGPAGEPGESCTVAQLAAPFPALAPNGGVMVTCGSASAIVANGANGVDGVTPPVTHQIVAVIDPCGAQGQFDEVLLRMGNGSIIASFSANGSAQTTRLVLLPDGSFSTTDQTSCNFSISTVGNVRTVTWSGGSYSYQL